MEYWVEAQDLTVTRSYTKARTEEYSQDHIFLKFSMKISSLHNIIFNSFRILFILWSLLVQTELSTSYIRVVQKSSSGDGKFRIQNSDCVGGAITFLALFQQIYTIGVGVILSQSCTKSVTKYLCLRMVFD